ncbi:NADH-quinone oxidoreductase subunit NuoE [Chloroflexota bacterium]
MVNPSVAQDTRVALPEQVVTIEERLDDILASYCDRADELIPILQQIQQEFGYLPESGIKQVARFLRLPEITVFGVATFYAQFKLVPTGRNVIKVCLGTACHVRGGARILQEVEKRLNIKAGESSPDLEYNLETVACFGACALSPVIVLNDKAHGRMTTQKVTSILDANGSSSELKGK